MTRYLVFDVDVVVDVEVKEVKNTLYFWRKQLHKAFKTGRKKGYSLSGGKKSSKNVCTQEETDKIRYVSLDKELDALFRTYRPKRG